LAGEQRSAMIRFILVQNRQGKSVRRLLAPDEARGR